MDPQPARPCLYRRAHRSEAVTRCTSPRPTPTPRCAFRREPCHGKANRDGIEKRCPPTRSDSETRPDRPDRARDPDPPREDSPARPRNDQAAGRTQQGGRQEGTQRAVGPQATGDPDTLAAAAHAFRLTRPGVWRRNAGGVGGSTTTVAWGRAGPGAAGKEERRRWKGRPQASATWRARPSEAASRWSRARAPGPGRGRARSSGVRYTNAGCERFFYFLERNLHVYGVRA